MEKLLRPIVSAHQFETIAGLNQVLEELSTRSRTAHLWIDCLIKPVMTMMKYIRAERESDWLLHIQAVNDMIPLFFAAGHHN